MSITARREWFRARVGMRVFRNVTNCDCPICKNVSEEGLIIDDKFHADYLYDIETEFTAERHPLRYFDTKEEVKAFVASIREPNEKA